MSERRSWAKLTDAEFATEIGYGLSLMTNAGKNQLDRTGRAWLWESYGDELVARLRAPQPREELRPPTGDQS